MFHHHCHKNSPFESTSSQLKLNHTSPAVTPSLSYSHTNCV